MMKIRTNLIQVLSLGLMLFVPSLSFALPETGERVTRQGTVNDDYYAAGGTVTIDADIAGDLVVSGGDLFLRHRVQGDVIAAGGTIKVDGDILDDARIAGGEITIDATVGDDLIVAGGEIKVSSATTAGGEAWLAGGDVYVAGTVKKDMYIGAGEIRLSGTFHGDVELEGGDIHILEGTLIEGDLRYRSPHEAEIHPGATIKGNVNYIQTEWDSPHRDFGVFFSLTLIVAGIVLYLLFPGFTLASAGRFSEQTWKSLGTGFVVFILTPVLAILLMSIFVGVWVGLSLLALYFVALLMGLLISCFFIGDWGARRLNQDVTSTARRLVSFVIAVILLGVIQLIPVLGGMFIFALLLSGLGAGILQLYFVYRQAGNV